MDEEAVSCHDLDVRALFGSFTIPEVVALLQPIRRPPGPVTRSRPRLLDWIKDLEPELRLRVCAEARSRRGTKRPSSAAQDGMRTIKRARMRPIPPEDMTRVDATLRLEGVMDGPFMVVPSQTVERDCIVRFIDRTGNEPLRKGVCIVCARSLFLFDLDACAPHELPAQELLHPTHPNPAHELHDGMLLHLEPSRSADEQTYACKACLAKLRLWQRPALSLANNMWIGRVPFALSALTFAERLLVALYLPAAYVVKLYPRRRGRTSWDEESIQKGMKGNVSTYRLPSSQIADMVAGNIMPRPAVVLAATVSVTFVGGGKTPLTVLPGLFCVRRGRVLQALRWLRANNRLYECVEISDSRLAELPEDGVPEEISSNVRYSDDVDAAQREHASYVPLDDDGETYGSDEECSELGDGEERLAEGTDRGRGAGDEDGDEELHTFDPHVFPLEANGSVDVAGDTVTDADLFAYAADNLMQTQQPAYAVRRGSTFVNEYAREDNGVRTDGGPTNPNHMMGAFPVLFPYGMGGLEVDREEAVGYESHIRWALRYSDGRFRRDFYFMFLAFGVVQKRQVCRSAALQVKRSVFVKYKSAFARLTAADFKAASAEEARRIPISNPVVRALRRQLTTLRSRVAGTDESRIAIRAQVWGMTLRFNPPSLWATINPADTADPIAQVLAGADIDLDRFVATAGPDSATRSRRIAADPFAAAEFFHYAVTVILEEIFGISVSPQGKIRRQEGIVGIINGYIGTVEAQARGTLHLHILFWLQGAPVPSVMRAALRSQAFRERMRTFISRTIRAHIPGTDGSTFLKLKRHRNVAYSRPVDPREADYERRAFAMEARVARVLQTHVCSIAACLRQKGGKLRCKRRAPWTVASDDWVKENGEWGPKRMCAMVNAWNPILLQAMRCNQDMKLVTNGADTRDITFYITLYIAKRQVQAANASALLAAANAFNARLTARQAECRDRHKRLIQQCANALSRQHEFSAPEVVSYLMGWGDRYLSHSYVRIYWDTICGMLRDRFPELNESDDRVVDSTMRVPDAADTEPLVPIIASEGVFKLTDQLKEYTDRGDELDDMSFYDYFVRTRDGSVVADTDNRPCEGGRVPNHRVPYLRSSGRKRCRVLRDVEQEVNLHFIGRWFPRATDPNRDMYAAQMLLLLMPWRHLEELKGNETSFGDMLDTFLATASPRVRAIVENIQYFYDCSDRAMERTEEAADGAGTVEEDDRADVLDISAEGPPPLTDAAVTDADIEDARREQYSAREHLYGVGAIAVALAHGLFQEQYTTSGRQAIAARATPEEANRYRQWTPESAASAAEGLGTTGREVDGAGVFAGSSAASEGFLPGVLDLTDQSCTAVASTLNREQQRAHDIVVSHLRRTLNGSNPSQLLMVVRGEGGTGKTVLLNAVSRSFAAVGASEMLAKTATTGVAASMLGGQTLHSWLGVSATSASRCKWQKTGPKMESRKRSILPTRYLVIDEYSMLTKRMLALVSEVIGVVKSNEGLAGATESFGGISVILFGDLHQFPPVGNPRQSLFNGDQDDHPYTKLGLCLYRQFTTVVTLTEQRRVDDPVWSALLRRLRTGSCTEADVAELWRLHIDRPTERRRVSDTGNEEVEWPDAVLVTPRHGARVLWNTWSLQKLSAQTGQAVYICPALDVVAKENRQLTRLEQLAVAGMNARQTGKLADRVEVAIGMRAMITLNIATGCDLANGTRGEVVDLKLDPREPHPLAQDDRGFVLLKFPPAVVAFRPDSQATYSVAGLPQGCLPLVPAYATFVARPPGRESVSVARCQLAITPAYAFTDYKAQGQTIPHLYVDLEPPPTGGLTPFNAYVALSRGRGRNSIRILRGFQETLFTRHPSEMLREEDARLDRLTVATACTYSN